MRLSIPLHTPEDNEDVFHPLWDQMLRFDSALTLLIEEDTWKTYGGQHFHAKIWTPEGEERKDKMYFGTRVDITATSPEGELWLLANTPTGCEVAP